jgi:hypothetical protein
VCFGNVDGGVCNQETCPSGCCDAFGVCQSGVTSTNCGSFGTTCNDCLAAGFLCSNQQCTTLDGGKACGSFNCNGCCDALGNCQNVESGNLDVGNAMFCGYNGSPCVDCATLNAAAPDGGPLCSQNCSGCCDAHGDCQLGLADTQCGVSGIACEDCTALSPPSTCNVTVPAAPQFVALKAVVQCANEEMQCPAPYPSCPLGLKEAVPTPQNVCSTDDLQSAGSACSAGPDTSGCAAFFAFEYSVNPGCYTCLSAFDSDFAGQIGIRLCVEPYVDEACNDNSACLVDCLTQSCYFCVDEASTDQCETEAQTGSCLTYARADPCVTQALDGAAALCNPATYQNDFGAWLQAVGAKYCGP